MFCQKYLITTPLCCLGLLTWWSCCLFNTKHVGLILQLSNSTPDRQLQLYCLSVSITFFPLSFFHFHFPSPCETKSLLLYLACVFFFSFFTTTQEILRFQENQCSLAFDLNVQIQQYHVIW